VTSLIPELAKNLLEIRDDGVHMTVLSAMDPSRFEKDILPGFKAAGRGDHVAAILGNGAVCWTYDASWAPALRYE